MKGKFRLSENDETHDDEDGFTVHVYRHDANMPHPCEFACNSDHPINAAARKGKTLVLRRGRFWITHAEAAKLARAS